MFVVKQAARALGHHLNSNVVPRIPWSRAAVALDVPSLRAQTLPALRSHINPLRGFATTAEQPKQKLDTHKKKPAKAADPDVLYSLIEIEIRCGDPAVLKSYNQFIVLAAQHLNLNIAHSEPRNKYHIKRWTVLKSRHVHRKHMVAYEVRTYHHKIQVARLTGSTADTFLEYIQRNLPEGVSMKVQRERIEKLPEHLQTPPSPDDV